ncbi:hypothetical protein BKA70DRAFT_358592 [Coprinopsis sp. MPI-PUGE-AT-0042]|nr:hypothetical protein BKA70DRAFT_358592 [Coprinopsis sp. MPI-PUGE-AT-0042]
MIRGTYLHHARDAFNRYGRTRQALKAALMSASVHATQPSLASLASLSLSILARCTRPSPPHMCCNAIGLPNPVEEVGRKRNAVLNIAWCIRPALSGYVVCFWCDSRRCDIILRHLDEDEACCTDAFPRQCTPVADRTDNRRVKHRFRVDGAQF